MGIEKSVVVLKRIYKLWFTNKEQDMSKCKLSISGATFVVDTEVGLNLFKILNEAQMEHLDYDYIPKKDSITGDSETLYYLRSSDEKIKLSSVDAEDYAMWKLYTSTRGNN